MKSVLKTFLAFLIAAFAGSAFAAPSGAQSAGAGSNASLTVYQQAPDCKNNPDDPRCKDKQNY